MGVRRGKAEDKTWTDSSTGPQLRLLVHAGITERIQM